LVIGPPGTAKTEITTKFAELIDATKFQYLLTRFSEPSELFGPMDINAFNEGKYTIRTDKMLPDVQIAFLDEVFQGSSAILNTLLTILNERIYYNGSERQNIPLISMIGASNIMPEDPWLKAFADRFILRSDLTPVENEQIEELIEKGWEFETNRIEANYRNRKGLESESIIPDLKIEALIELNHRLKEVDLSGIRAEYHSIIREVRAEGVELSDRRVVKGMKLIAGAALLRESDKADVGDFWPVNHMWTRVEEKDVLKNVVSTHIKESDASAISAVRPVADIVMDFETIESQEAYLNSESAVGAHLSALNKLRRELICDHPNDTEPLKRIGEAINRSLSKLEA